MTLKTLAAAACISLATATTGYAAPINLDFEFDGVTGTLFGLDDADGTSSASSFSLVFDTFRFTEVALPSFNNTFEFSGGELTDVAFLSLPGAIDDTGSLTLVRLNLVFGTLGLALAGFESAGFAEFSDGTSTSIAPASFDITPVSAVPLPAGGLLLLSGLGGIAAFQRRKKRAA